MLAPLTKEETAAEQRVRIARFTRTTKSPVHCVGCATYVGHLHLLSERSASCLLGSETCA